MKIIFLGSDNFAVPALQAIASAGYAISCVVTQPDRSKGRGLNLAATPIKKAASELSLKLYQPDDINTPEAGRFLKSLSPDLLVVVAYGQILSQEILDTPTKLSINLHASLLPKYRGAAPINWAMIKGESATGVTVMEIEKKMDAGAIILQQEIAISADDNAVTLEEKLAGPGAKLLVSALKKIEDKSYRRKAQEEKSVSYAPKLKRQDGLIDWQSSAKEINDLIRGTLGWPGAFTHYRSKILKVFQAEVFAESELPKTSRPGEIIKVATENIIISTGDGFLAIKELQLEAGKRQKVKEFLAGHKVTPGENLV